VRKQNIIYRNSDRTAPALQQLRCFCPDVHGTYRFTSPIVRVRVENESTLVGKDTVKDEGKDGKDDGRQPHEPRCAARPFVVGGKGKEDQRQQQADLDFLPNINHGGGDGGGETIEVKA
jgi:hypothetical protein